MIPPTTTYAGRAGQMVTDIAILLGLYEWGVRPFLRSLWRRVEAKHAASQAEAPLTVRGQW